MANDSSLSTGLILAAAGSGITAVRGASSELVTILVAEGTGTRNRVAGSLQTLPAITGEGWVSAPVPILLPAATGGTAMAGRLGESSGFMLAMQVTAGSGHTASPASSVQMLALLQAQGTGQIQRRGGSSQALMPMLADGAASTGRLAGSSLMLALMEADSSGSTASATAGQSLQAAKLLTLGEGTATTGRSGASVQTLALLLADSVGGAGLLGGSSAMLPVFEAAGDGQLSRTGLSVLTLPGMQGQGAGGAGSMGASALVLSMWQGAGTGMGSGLASSILVLPAWIATGEASGNAPVLGGLSTAQGKSYAVHSESFAQSRDTGATFNSYARLGMVLLAASDEGLFMLGAADDQGMPIEALLKFPLQDAEGAQLRRVASMVVGYRADGDLRLTMQTDDGEASEYVLESVGGTACHPNRVKVGKGDKGRYWTGTLENIDGADFAIDKIDMDWQVLSRRLS